MIESINKRIDFNTGDRGEDADQEIRFFPANRYTVIRNQPINTREYGADYLVDTQLGIRVLTDSKKIAEEVKLTLGGQENPGSAIDFVYLTKRAIEPMDDSEIPPRPISKGVLGDLVVDSNLAQYVLAGPDKFGSVESVMFGIYSFERAKEGFLGIHAAQIYDRKKDVNHLLIGQSGMGKSTLAQLLENIKPNRFEVVADDWVEIDQSQKHVRPISTTLGSHAGKLNDDLVKLNNRVNEPFVSFGKNFYTYDSANKFSGNIGKIIQLSDPSHQSSEKEILDYFIELNRNVPFITQARREMDFLPPEVANRLRIILKSYLKLRAQKSFLVLDLNEVDINKRIGKILKVLG